jgi:hypothetical protein
MKSEDSKLGKYWLLLGYCVRLLNMVFYNEGIICQVIENTVIGQEYEANMDKVSNSRQIEEVSHGGRQEIQRKFWRGNHFNDYGDERITL